MSKLKTCPFCGGEAEITETGVFRNQDCYVQCKCCGACTKFCFGDECRKQAINDWNKRYEPEPLNVVVPINVDKESFWQAQEGDCCCGNHIFRDENVYCNRCGRRILWEKVK